MAANIPPPSACALLPERVTLVINDVQSFSIMPPPCASTSLFITFRLVIAGLPPLMYIPPPETFEKLILLIFRSEIELPPPPSA
ncbi:hypothetical protein D9M68_997610 [compost metagenome]